MKFIETIGAAMRRHDPNHLNLGLRFGSSAPPEIVKASKGFDVYSLNSYAYTVNQREVQKVRELIDRPILIGEFHFGTPGRGMTPGLRQTASQEERGVAYRYYVENAMADPNLVGAHWFEWVDEASTGRFDGENYNIGMLDVTDRPVPRAGRCRQGDPPPADGHSRRQDARRDAAGQGPVSYRAQCRPMPPRM